MNDIIDIFIGFFRENLYLGHCSQVIGQMREEPSKCSTEHLRILEMVGDSAGTTRVLNLFLTYLRLLQTERELTIGTPQIYLKGQRVLMGPVI